MEHCKDNCTCECHRCDCCIRFREEWNAGSIYRPCDAVPYNGSSYAAIHWNQNDPPPSPNWALIASKGDTGPAGPQGEVGPRGPAGPSTSSETFVSYATAIVNFGNDGTDFAQIKLPAGSYVIWATVQLRNTDTDPQSWGIELSATNGASIQGNVSGRIAALPESSIQVVPILATCESPTSGTTVTFRGFGFNISVYPNNGGRTCSIAAMPSSIISA